MKNSYARFVPIVLFAVMLLLMACLPSVALAADSSHGGGEDGMPVYIEMEPIVIPVVDGVDGVVQVVAFEVTLDTDNDGAAIVNARLPRLRDAYIQAVYGDMEQNMLLQNKVLNIPRLKEFLTKETTRVVGEHVVNDVLIQSITQRTF